MEAIQTTGTHKMRAMIDVPVGISEPLPIVLMAHGIGERSDTVLNYVTKYGPLKQIEDGVELPFKFIAVAPQLPKYINQVEQKRWNPAMIWEVIQHMRDHYAVDSNRIYVTGVSLGGGGIWSLIGDPTFVKQIAAAVIICGGFGPEGKEMNIINAGIPIWCAHAHNDPTVPYNTTANAVWKINTGAGREQARFSRQGLFGHAIWNKIFDPDHGVYDWLKYQRLDQRVGEAKFNDAIKILDDAIVKLEALR